MTVKLPAGLLPYHRIGACSLSPVRFFARLSCASLVALVLPLASLCQAPPTPDAQPAGGGNSTGGVHAAVHDAENRPITAGGFVATGPIVFEDATQKSGLGGFHHVMGTAEKKFIIETMGSGVGLLDYDNDGWLDIYLVNGSTYEAMEGKAAAPHAALFHNNHDGTFTDVTAHAGVANDRWGFGVAIGDYDNDGWPDIFVSNFGKNRLYRNNHDGTFTDVGEKAGVGLGTWSTGATFGDYDGDGRLDLFVPGYIHYDMNNPPVPGSKSVAYSFCNFRGVSVMCGPRGLEGEHDHLFHGNSDGTFTDVSEKAGVSDPNRYYGFTGIFADINNDGKVDLVVTDDSTPNYLYINKGNGTFEDDSYASGFALNQDGRETASMGLGVGDYENNGRLDFMVTTFSDDYKVLYHNDGDANFTDVSYHSGIAQDTIPFLGWGVGFLDYDNDGWKDLLMVNGHVYPAVDKQDWGTSFAQRPLLYRNLEGKKFQLIPPVKDSGLAVVTPGRGAAFGDLFNDGKIDVVINSVGSTPVLLRNVNPDTHHWVELKLVGGPKSPRDAVGSAVYLTANGMRQRGDVISGGSYMSSNDQRVHFGLGDATSAGEVEIHWPSGTVEKVSLPSIDRIFTIEESKGITGELCAACKTAAATKKK
jgi:enediyne biosynthesis protein E4